MKPGVATTGRVPLARERGAGARLRTFYGLLAGVVGLAVAYAVLAPPVIGARVAAAWQGEAVSSWPGRVVLRRQPMSAPAAPADADRASTAVADASAVTWVLRVTREPVAFERGLWRSRARDRWHFWLAADGELSPGVAAAPIEPLASGEGSPFLSITTEAAIVHHPLGARISLTWETASPPAAMTLHGHERPREGEAMTRAGAALARDLRAWLDAWTPPIHARVSLRRALTLRASADTIDWRASSVTRDVLGLGGDVWRLVDVQADVALGPDERLFALTASTIEWSAETAPSRFGPDRETVATHWTAEGFALSVRARQAPVVFSESPSGIDLAVRAAAQTLRVERAPASDRRAGRDGAAEVSGARPSRVRPGVGRVDLIAPHVDLLTAVQHGRRDVYLRAAWQALAVDGVPGPTPLGTTPGHAPPATVTTGHGRVRIEARRLDAATAEALAADLWHRFLADGRDRRAPREASQADAATRTMARGLALWAASAARGATLQAAIDVAGPLARPSVALSGFEHASTAPPARSAAPAPGSRGPIDTISDAPRLAAELHGALRGSADDVRLRPLESLDVLLRVDLYAVAPANGRADTGQTGLDAQRTPAQDRLWSGVAPDASVWPWPATWWQRDGEVASVVLRLYDGRLVVSGSGGDNGARRWRSVPAGDADDRTGEWLGWWFSRGGGMF